VTALAADLDTPARRAQLTDSLTALQARAAGLHAVTAAVDGLLADPDAAWRWLAAALLADELS
jgi:phosphatidylserine synthase